MDAEDFQKLREGYPLPMNQRLGRNGKHLCTQSRKQVVGLFLGIIIMYYNVEYQARLQLHGCQMFYIMFVYLHVRVLEGAPISKKNTVLGLFYICGLGGR